MGIFDFLGKKKRAEPTDAPAAAERKPAPKPAAKKVNPKEVARFERLVGNKLSQNYDRQEAIEELTKMATAESAAALLKRFNWSMDPSITDQEEKESAARGIVAAGDAALDPIREYCKRAESLTWPLKVLREILHEDHYVDELLGLLDLFDTEYVRNPEPKVQLISTLENHPSEDVRVAVEPFLGDASEPVRFTAAGTVFAMNDPTSVAALIAALEEEESLRVKNRIAQGLADRAWPIPEELLKTAKTSLPPDFRLDGEHVRRTR